MMDFQTVKIRGMLMGVANQTDYETKKIVGVQLDIGVRSASGRFVTNTIKVLGANQADFISSLDELVVLELEDVTINSYMAGNRPALSVKAQKVAFL